MKDNARAAVAFIVAKVISNIYSNSVYDYSQSSHLMFSGTVSKGSVNIYSHKEGCHISGSLNSLYHFGNSNHFTLNIKGTRFDGYDFDTKNHFNGSVNGGSISIYDFGTSEYHQYTC